MGRGGPGPWGAGTALVGSHAEIAQRLAEYAQLGINHFILSGYPHLEEAYWFGEGVLPLLERMGLWEASQPSVAPGNGDAVRGRLGALTGHSGDLVRARNWRRAHHHHARRGRRIRRAAAPAAAHCRCGKPVGHHRGVVLFFLYATAAGLVFNRVFFPGESSVVGTLLAFATFAVGFVMRPIGGAGVRPYPGTGSAASAAWR